MSSSAEGVRCGEPRWEACALNRNIAVVLCLPVPRGAFTTVKSRPCLRDSVQSALKSDFDMMRQAGDRNIFSRFDPSSETERAITLIGEEIVKCAADRAKDLGVAKVGARTVDDDPADGILKMTEETGADMIMVGHRGLGRVRSLLMGSVAHKLNTHASCTVVMVRSCRGVSFGR
ncbi:universal stress protein [Roseovarius sp. S1116L3]|uniref:universal stress protein n=1 Tax=Roseovarius roseus TaxID=3342636 RepID=UPI00372841AE